MHGGCVRPQVQRAFADTAYRERRHLRLQRVHLAAGTNTCRNCSNIVRRRPYCGSRPQHTQMQAFRRPTSSSPSEPTFSDSPVVDITAEPATTSGRDSENGDSQQHRPSIIRRAAAAAVGILHTMFQWLRTHLKPWKLFDRCNLHKLGCDHGSGPTTSTLHSTCNVCCFKDCLYAEPTFHVQHVDLHIASASLQGVQGDLVPAHGACLLCLTIQSYCCRMQALSAVRVVFSDGFCHHDICQSGCKYYYHKAATGGE